MAEHLCLPLAGFNFHLSQPNPASQVLIIPEHLFQVSKDRGLWHQDVAVVNGWLLTVIQAHTLSHLCIHLFGITAPLKVVRWYVLRIQSARLVEDPCK